MGAQLIEELINDPKRFDGEKSNALLAAYFKGLNLDTLRPLLHHSEPLIQRTAAWIASELGAKAAPLLREVVDLCANSDPQIRFYAFEIIAVSSSCSLEGTFAHVARGLSDIHEGVRKLTMLLVGNSSKSQIVAARGELDGNHKVGLSVLLQADVGDISELIALITDSDPLLRKYAAIAAYRFNKRYPNDPTPPTLIQAATEVQDPEIQHFIDRHIGAFSA